MCQVDFQDVQSGFPSCAKWIPSCAKWISKLCQVDFQVVPSGFLSCAKWMTKLCQVDFQVVPSGWLSWLDLSCNVIELCSAASGHQPGSTFSRIFNQFLNGTEPVRPTGPTRYVNSWSGIIRWLHSVLPPTNQCGCEYDQRRPELRI